MASQAGSVNAYGQLGGIPILSIPPNSAAVAYGAYGTNTGPPAISVSTNPYAGGVSYFPTVGNDSGAQMALASGYSKWGISLIGPGVTGAGTAQVTVSVYGTWDPALRLRIEQNPGNSYQNSVNAEGSLTILPATSWTLLPGVSAQSGTGTEANPITTGASGASMFYSSVPVAAIRVVVTGTAATTATGALTVLAFAIP